MSTEQSTRPVRYSSVGTDIAKFLARASWLAIAVGLFLHGSSRSRTVEAFGAIGIGVSLVVVTIAFVGINRRNLALYGGDKAAVRRESKADRAERPGNRNRWVRAAGFVAWVLTLAAIALPNSAGGPATVACTVAGFLVIARTGMAIQRWVALSRWNHSKPDHA